MGSGRITWRGWLGKVERAGVDTSSSACYLRQGWRELDVERGGGGGGRRGEEMREEEKKEVQS